MHAIVHAADVQDRDGGVLLMATLFGAYPFLLKLYADSGYTGPKFQTGLARVCRQVDVEIVKRSDASRFVVLPKRWIVERTIAWLNRCRRLAGGPVAAEPKLHFGRGRLPRPGRPMAKSAEVLVEGCGRGERLGGVQDEQDERCKVSRSGARGLHDGLRSMALHGLAGTDLHSAELRFVAQRPAQHVERFTAGVAVHWGRSTGWTAGLLNPKEVARRSNGRHGSDFRNLVAAEARGALSSQCEQPGLPRASQPQAMRPWRRLRLCGRWKALDLPSKARLGGARRASAQLRSWRPKQVARRPRLATPSMPRPTASKERRAIRRMITVNLLSVKLRRHQSAGCPLSKRSNTFLARCSNRAKRIFSRK